MPQKNMKMIKKKSVLTIAGSDSGGGAGIQADLKTFTALGVFGTSAITCITAQNPAEVRGILGIPPAMIRLQIEAVCDGLRPVAAKTGMLYTAAIIAEVARIMTRRRIKHLVVDPVMVATSGARLLRQDAAKALCEKLLPLANVITPNLPEAEALCGRRITDLAAARAAAEEIGRKFQTACILKGGHLPLDMATDILYARGATSIYRARRLRVTTHGSGCMFSAALTAHMARGLPLVEAVRQAKKYVHKVLSAMRA